MSAIEGRASILGRAWIFGDNIDTDVIISGVHMKFDPQVIAKYCFEAIAPDLAAQVKDGDIVVGGANFGMGSSREQAPQVLKILGVGAVLASSFARIFYRNALNLGLPALILPEAREIAAGDTLEVDPVAGTVANQTQGKDYGCDPIPAHLMEMITDGGLMAHLKKKIDAGEL